MTDERSSIHPEDWPLEETTTDENSYGLRHDTGKTSAVPEAEEVGPNAAPSEGGRGETGTTTPGERGADSGPR